jgi:hypothetical protein
MPRPCELCTLEKVTQWYAEFNEPVRFVVLDCDSCDVPMAVLRDHRAEPTEEEKELMQEALAAVAKFSFPQGWFFDDHMKQIPDHYHMHVRPMPPGLRH